MSTQDGPVDMSSCRICLCKKKVIFNLYDCSVKFNYAYMLNACTGIKASIYDGYPDSICLGCSRILDRAFALKETAEKSAEILRINWLPPDSKELVKKYAAKKISFNTITDIRTELDALNVKCEPKLEFEIEILDKIETKQTFDTINGKDIVICNTVIRKLNANGEYTENNNNMDDSDFNDMEDIEYLEDDLFKDDSDDDYLPPTKMKKEKFKKPKLSDIKVFKENKRNMANRPKAMHRTAVVKPVVKPLLVNNVKTDRPSTFITCYPLLANGEKGPPVLLKRPNDASICKSVRARVRPKGNKNGETPSQRLYVSKDTEMAVRRKIKSVQPQVKPKEKHVCPVCGILTFGLANHMLTHVEKKPYQCDHCPRSFSQRNNYLIHMKKHTGIKDHVCEICGAGFYCQKSVLRHKLIHKGERPFHCEICPKKFIAKCDLNRHLRIHAGYKPFKCTVCTMSFNAKHQLQNHVRMHTGERPYTCQVCDVAFSYKVNLNNHVFRVHGINLKFKSIHTITAEVIRKESASSALPAEPLTTSAAETQAATNTLELQTQEIVFQE